MTLAQPHDAPAVESTRPPSSGDERSVPLRVRWLGRVPYQEAWDLQRRLFAGSTDHLLLLEHPPVYTLGRRGREDNLLVDVEAFGAEVHRIDRGGDITFHGPGQLVGYPVMSVASRRGLARGVGMADTVAYVDGLEQSIIDVVGELGLVAGRRHGHPGVWLDADNPTTGGSARKVAAIGVRLSRGRSMHGFAINNTVDLDWFDRMVPCGIDDAGVTSLASEGIEVGMEELTDRVAVAFANRFRPDTVVERADVVRHHAITDLAPFSRGEGPGEPARPTTGPKAALDPSTDAGDRGVPVRLKGRLAQAGVAGGLDLGARKPEWMRVRLRTDENYVQLKKTARSLDLTTVCEEAGCPNIFDCWNEGTATFMLLGERCTRACGFCLVDTSRPGTVDPDEPGRVADAVDRLGLSFAVLTMVARDDLDDGGAAIVAATVEAIHQRCPGVGVEVLISDLAGSDSSLQAVCGSGPEVLNHNIETVARLQRAVRPSAGYARSLTVLARAGDMGMATKSGLIVGMGETFDEVVATLGDLSAVGVDIVTIGQYLRPTSHHLPIHRWWDPAEFDELRRIGEQELGIGHVAASPLTRSSHRAGSIVDSLEA